MRPIMLHGHERAITQIRYSREGDLLLTCSKDPVPNIWYSLNGERLGTLQGHTGTVWDIDIDWKTTSIVTASADNSCKIWDCETGKMQHDIGTSTAGRSCGWSYSGNMFMYTTDKTMGHQCYIYICDSKNARKGEEIRKIAVEESKVTSAIWGPNEEYIITGHDNGELRHYDVKSGKMVLSVKQHPRQINDIQPSSDLSMIITASSDSCAKLFDTETLEHLKTYKTDRPVNSASISPIKNHIILGGGQEAMNVTTTSTKIGKFDAILFDLVFMEEFGRIKGHFGPINSVAFHPDGKGYSSGGEDGVVRIHSFDDVYFDFQFEY